MSEGFERVGGFIEIGAVAIEASTLVSEVDLTVEDGGVGIQALVIVEHIGMNKIYTGILNLRPTGWALGLSFLGISVETGVTHQYTRQSQQI